MNSVTQEPPATPPELVHYHGALRHYGALCLSPQAFTAEFAGRWTLARILLGRK